MPCDPAQSARPGRMVLERLPCLAVAAALAAVLGLSPPGLAWAGAIPDGQWEGEWDPGSSCRDTRKRKMTATTEGDHIHGRVVGSSGRAGVFGADIAGGRFRTALAGLKRDTFSLYGKANPEEISGTWSGRDDCGSGSFVLHRIAPEPAAAAQTPAPGQPGPAAAAPVGDPAALEALENLYRRGLITEAEYAEKLAMVRGAAAPISRPAPAQPAPQAAPARTAPQAAAPAAPAGKPAVLLEAPAEVPVDNSRLTILEQLMSEDLITAEEYERKRAEIQAGGN